MPPFVLRVIAAASFASAGEYALPRLILLELKPRYPRGRKQTPRYENPCGICGLSFLARAQAPPPMPSTLRQTAHYRRVPLPRPIIASPVPD